jgi:hypothetical protein
MNTDITAIRFSDKARWAGKKVEYDNSGKKIKGDKFNILDKRLLEDKINKEEVGQTTKDFNLGSIKTIGYRSYIFLL